MPTKFFMLAFIALSLWAVPMFAQQTDPHAIYEKNCSGCHAPHAGDFVLNGIQLSDGTIVGKSSGRKVALFLTAGHGGLSPSEINILMDHFMAITQSGRLFFTKCRVCHKNAKQVARVKLLIRDGSLVGRYTGWEIEQFLTNHGRLDPEEVPVMVGVLKRQLTVLAPQ